MKGINAARAWGVAGVVAVVAIILFSRSEFITGGDPFHGLSGYQFRTHAVQSPDVTQRGCETTSPTDKASAVGGLSQHIRYVATANKPAPEVTHFGGQPSWLEAPEWPISKRTGKQMTFIGQMVISKDTFPEAKGKVAYLFMTDGPDYVDWIWDPDAGENAVIIQPGDPGSIPVRDAKTGPTEPSYVSSPGHAQLVEKNVVYSVIESPHVDAPFQSDSALTKLAPQEQQKYLGDLAGDKLGGTPSFIQPPEFPCAADKLLLQIETPPFLVNLGDGGVGYAFLNREATVGKFLWQSH